MGISSDGIVFFGFPVGDEEETPLSEVILGTSVDEEQDFEWEEVYARRVDSEYKGRYPDGPDGEYDSNAWEHESMIVKASHCTIGMYCSYDYPMHYVGLESSVVRAARGYCKPLSLERPSDEDVSRLRAFCEVMNIPWQEPGWHLASMYG